MGGFWGPLQQVLAQVAPGMPPEFWWVTGMVLVILTLAAAVDAFTGIVPDALVLTGLVAVAGLIGFYAGWPVALLHLRDALLAGLAIWAINYVWLCLYHSDALGMGDAKWTMLAVACFGLQPLYAAWGIGACLALIWLAAARVLHIAATRVTFAPFLLVGLVSGLYAFRFF